MRRRAPGRQRDNSVSTGSLSVILADLRERGDRKRARRELSRGIIGLGSIPTTAQLPTLNSPPHSRTQAIATPPMISAISGASANARPRARGHGRGDLAFCRPCSAQLPATALVPILSKFCLGCLPFG